MAEEREIRGGHLVITRRGRMGLVVNEFPTWCRVQFAAFTFGDYEYSKLRRATRAEMEVSNWKYVDHKKEYAGEPS